jgi:hypothetical protein
MGRLSFRKDEEMIPYKIFLPVVGAAMTLIIGTLSLLFPIPMIWAIVGMVVLGIVAIVIAERQVYSVQVFAHWSLDARAIVFRFIAVAIAVDDAVAIALKVAGIAALPLGLLALAGLTAVQMLAGALLDPYLAQQRPRLQKVRQERAQAVSAGRAVDLAPHVLEESDGPLPAVTESHDVMVMRLALKRIKRSWVKVVEPEPLRDEDGVLFGIRFKVRIPASAMANKNRTLSTEDAEPIAVALSELLNKELETRWVAIQKMRLSGRYTITVTTQDIMARLYPFVDEPEWADIRKPMLIGYGLDAKPVHLSLRQHGQYIGKTRSGKTSLIHNVLAYLTRCENAVVWICGTEKIYDLLAGWLEIYLDTGEEMPFDFVCVGPEDSAECLAALMRVARYRQSLRLHERVNLPDIVCIIEEAMYTLRNTTVTAEYDGQQHHASALLGMNMQGAGSAGCFAKYLTQRDTIDQLGPMGGDIQAQTGYAVAFNSQDTLSLGRQLGDYKLPPPAHKGEFYVKDDEGEAYPVLVKGRYIQEDDPSKPVLHNGPTLSEISWSRRKFKTYLDEGSQRAAGKLYAQRHTTVTMEFLDYLRKNKSPMTVVDSRPIDKEVDIDAEARQLAEEMGLDFDTISDVQREAFREVAKELKTDIPDDEMEELQDLTPPEGRTDQILWALRRANKPLTSTEIMDVLRDAGVTIKSENAVYNLLGQLVTKNVLIKGEDRTYRLAC